MSCIWNNPLFLYITTHVNNYQYRIQAEKRVKELHVEIDQLEVEQDRLMNRIAELSTKPLENRKKIEEAWIDAQIKRDDIKIAQGRCNRYKLGLASLNAYQYDRDAKLMSKTAVILKDPKIQEKREQQADNIADLKAIYDETVDDEEILRDALLSEDRSSVYRADLEKRAKRFVTMLTLEDLPNAPRSSEFADLTEDETLLLHKCRNLSKTVAGPVTDVSLDEQIHDMSL